MSKIHPLLSRKLLVTLIGIIVAGLTQQFPNQQAHILAIAGMVSTYVLGQSWVDASAGAPATSSVAPSATVEIGVPK